MHLLRVMLDPERAEGIDMHLAWEFPGITRTGLHIRNCVACPTDGDGATTVISGAFTAWADVLTGAITFSNAHGNGQFVVDGDVAGVQRALACFEVDGLRA